MREIKLDPQDPSRFRCHTTKSASVHLYEAAPKQYALVEPDGMNVLYAFKSKALDCFLEKNTEPITEAALYESNCRFGRNRRMIVELRLTLSDGYIFTITDWEKVYRTQEIKQGSRHAKTLYSPYSAWSIPPDEPYVYMLLTGRLIDHLDSIATDGQHRHLLNVMWYEHRNAWEQLDEPKPLNVECEFMQFKATPLNRHLIAFDTIK